MGALALLLVAGCSDDGSGSGTPASEAQAASLRLEDLPPGEWELDPSDFTPKFGDCPELPPVADDFDQVVYGNDQHWVFQAVGRADEPERRMDAAAEHAVECRPAPTGKSPTSSGGPPEDQGDIRPLELPRRGDRTVGMHAEGTASNGARLALDIAYVQLADVVSMVGVFYSPDRPGDPPPVELLNDLVERALRRMTVEAP